MQFNKQKSPKAAEDKKQEKNPTQYKLDHSLDANVKLFKDIFNDNDTIVFRFFENRHDEKIKYCIIFIEGMADKTIINENIIKPVVQNPADVNISDILGNLKNQVIYSNSIEKTQDVSELTAAVISGDTVLLAEGSAVGLIICTKGWKNRSIEEPQGERVISGPREGFIEALTVNLSMIRRRIETPELKMKLMTLGVQTHTKICVCYIEGIVNRKILDEVFKRLKGINIDGVLDSGYIKELIMDSPLSIFKTVGDTERPDTVAAKLLEGRIAVLADGSPVVLTIPYLFMENFQSNEDYYINFYIASFNRILRILSFIISFSVPAIYTALVTFHQETIPTTLLLSISTARQGVPFPTIVEIILLLLSFEMLREAGLRMPNFVGQALSIVGALVLGTASVEAKLVSAPIVIIVSLTAISSLMIPVMESAISILRLLLLLLSAFIGLYGYIFGVMGLMIHLYELRSFGVPYMMTLIKFEPSELKDTAIRMPWWYIRRRPHLITANRIRQSGGGKSS